MVTRDAVIRVRIEQQKAKLEAPDASPAERAYEKERKAATEATRAVEQHNRVTRETATISTNTYREMGEGALRAARGIALLSASGSEDLRKLMQTVALAQGAFDVFAGSTKAIGLLAGVVGVPWTAAITGITAVVGAGTVAWNKYQSSIEEAAKAFEEVRKKAIEFEKQQAQMWERQRSREATGRDRQDRFGRLRLDASLTPQEREFRLAAEQERLGFQMEDIETDRRRRLRGFLPSNFGGSESEAFRNLLQFGSESQLGHARDFELRRQSVAERQFEVSKDQFDAQKKTLDTQREMITKASQFAVQGAAGIGVPQFAGLAATGAAAAGQQFINTFDQSVQEITQRARDALDDIVDTMEKAAERALHIERKLDGANTR